MIKFYCLRLKRIITNSENEPESEFYCDQFMCSKKEKCKEENEKKGIQFICKERMKGEK